MVLYTDLDAAQPTANHVQQREENLWNILLLRG